MSSGGILRQCLRLGEGGGGMRGWWGGGKGGGILCQCMQLGDWGGRGILHQFLRLCEWQSVEGRGVICM